MAEENRQRQHRLSVFLLEEEKIALQLKCHEAGMSQSEYIRNMIVFGAAHERTVFSKEETRNWRYEINRIGNNINQIAYRVNSARTFEQNDFVLLEQLYGELLQAYNNILDGIFGGV